ncbi:MAG TPA: hypothetical protein VE978_08510 [Chitinophagales bacterium]|nr:hypothetical protein [Chitinophagales bacterium]
MKYNPQIHHRRSIRLKVYDYSQEGAYLITIVCHDRKHFFGNVENGFMKLNSFGRIAYEEWQKLPERFPNIEVDVFQIMPNHMHGIIVIVGAPLAGAPAKSANNVNAPNTDAHNANKQKADAHDAEARSADIGNSLPNRAPARGAPTVGEMIGSYKSIVADKCLELWKSKRPDQMMGKLWQRNFYEHIIRNEESLNDIREYIIDNPRNWETDSENNRLGTVTWGTGEPCPYIKFFQNFLSQSNQPFHRRDVFYSIHLPDRESVFACLRAP